MDGGFTNNNPADIMKKRGSKRTIVVKVGDEVGILNIIWFVCSLILNIIRFVC